MIMGLYTNKGLYNRYKKNNKEREALDYYATPPDEVTNILFVTNARLDGKVILEPCVGGGHMAQGITSYFQMYNMTPKICIGTDVKDRGFEPDPFYIWTTNYGDNFDFLGDNYKIPYHPDYIIMNPPYSIIEPFIIRALEFNPEKLYVLCRLQTIEGIGRYTNIFKNNPPSDIYQYIDRIKCWKNGNNDKEASAQAYCWLVWDRMKNNTNPELHWIRKAS